MKGCCGLIALLLCCGAGGYAAISVDPNLPGQVVADGAAGVGWAAGVLSHIGATPRPQPVVVSPLPLITPPTSPTTPPSATPTPTPTLPPSSSRLIVVTPVSTAPPATPAPSPTSSAPWTINSAWSTPDRAWAIYTLETDRADDTAAESRFPTEAWYYAGWAQHWSDALTLISGLEYPQTRPPQQVYLAPAEDAFAEAIALHQADEQTTPGNAWWDNWWIAAYQRLTGLWELL